MKNDFLKGKRILFICQRFYDYHEKIQSELKNSGAHVVFYESKVFREDPILNSNDFISKVKRIFNPSYKINYCNQILNDTATEKFDILFCIGGFSITNDFVNEIKRRNEGLKTIIYYWDSFKVWPFQFLLSSFDKAYSFDRDDCLTYNINYLPLFFSEDSNVITPYNKRDIDFLYVGSVGPPSVNRFKFLSAFYEFCVKNQFTSYIYVFYNKPQHNPLIKGVNVVRKIVDAKYNHFANSLQWYSNKYKFVYYTPLTKAQLNALFARSKCVIDISVTGQVGLTMRSIEALSMGCKLVTTNSYIEKEPFYNKEWIKVIQEDNWDIDMNFLKMEPMSDINIIYLSLENWLNNIINNNTSTAN